MSILQKPPQIHDLTQIRIPEVDFYKIDGSVPVYRLIKAGSDVIKMDLVFEAGRPYEDQKLAATMCARLLREGTASYTAEDIAEELDFYGVSMSIGASLDTITVSMVVLSKHFNRVLPILQSILTEPLFLQKELDTLVNRLSERLKLDLQKNDVLAYRTITEIMYGHDHPYGYNSSEERYRQLTPDHLHRHYKSHIHRGSLRVFVAGDMTDDDSRAIEEMIMTLPAGAHDVIDSVPAPMAPTSDDRRRTIVGTGSQATVRLGRPLFAKGHADYYPTAFMINILGGFFGSRLVAKVREELGLTYGIYAMPDTQIHGGTMMISTDIAETNVELCLQTVYSEMDRLCQELVGDDEMRLAKNYVAGNYINLFDGPFNSLRSIKSLVLARIPLDNIRSIIDISQSITAEEVRDYAQRYLNRNDFWEVVVRTTQ